MDEPSSVSEDAVVLTIGEFARRYVSKTVDPDVANDVVQDVTIACLKKLRRGRLNLSSASLCALVRRMVRHRESDWRRSRRRQGERDGQHQCEWSASPHRWMAPDAAIEDAELRAFYVATRNSLPTMCLHVYSMIREDGAPYQEVADWCGITLATVRWHLAVAHRRFRAAFKERNAQVGRPLR